MSPDPPEPALSRAERRRAAEAEKEAFEVIDRLVTRLLGELADAVWGRNGALRRQWALQREGRAWVVRHAGRPETFRVTVEITPPVISVECAGDPIRTTGIDEAQLRRALAVAHHRGPRGAGPS
jgi:hypothetical protein